MRSHNIEILGQAALLKLYQHGLESRARLNAKGIRALFTVDVSELFLDHALHALEEAGMVYGSHAGIRGSVYEIEHAGITAVQDAISKTDTPVSQISEHGDKWLLEEDRSIVSDTLAHKPRFTEFRDALIIALYEKSSKEGLIVFKLKELADECNIRYRDGWIDEVSNFLNNHGYALVRKSMLGDENAVAKLNASGLEYAEKLIAEAESEDNAPDVEPLFEIAGSSDTVTDDDGIPLVTVPASDRIVKLDHNRREYRETIAALSELSEEAKKSNEFGELFVDPEDKVVVLSQIDTGTQLLRNKKVIPDVVKRVLEYPLRFIKEKMPDAALAALASKAWDWLMKLFENVI